MRKLYGELGSYFCIADLGSPMQKLYRELRSNSRIVNLRSRFTIFLDSSMVEHAAVNRGVVGSSPTRGVV